MSTVPCAEYGSSPPVAGPGRGGDERGAPYVQLWLACLMGFCAIGMTMQVMPAYAQERFGAGSIAAGLAVTIGSLATMFARPVSGRLADQLGGRSVAMVGAVLGLTGGIGHILAANLPELLLARLLLGAGEGALFTGAVGWVLDYANPLLRGKVAGHFGLSMWMGLASGPILGGALLAATSYRAVWIAASVVSVLACGLVASTRSDSRVRVDDVPMRRALIPKVARAPGASGVFASIGYGVIVAFLVPRFVALDFQWRNLALGAFGLAFIVARYVGSGYADRFGATRVLLCAYLVESAGLAGLFVTRSEGVAFVSTAVVGAALSMLIPSVTSLVTSAADPRERTAALGSVTSAWDLGIAVGGPLGGVVAGVSDAGPFALGAVAALIAIAPLAGARRRAVAERSATCIGTSK